MYIFSTHTIHTIRKVFQSLLRFGEKMGTSGILPWKFDSTQPLKLPGIQPSVAKNPTASSRRDDWRQFSTSAKHWVLSERFFSLNGGGNPAKNHLLDILKDWVMQRTC